jgi:adenylate kinase
MLGVPGAGKGTQAKRLGDLLGFPHVSSGDLFRKHLDAETDLGHEAQKYLSRGELVPDEITIQMIEEHLASGEAGAILDGFPRTAPQAKALRSMEGSNVLAVVFIDVPVERLVERMAGRRVCRKIGHVYHIEYNPPAKEGICDTDGSELYLRDDDKPETVRHRLSVYKEKTAPLIDFYRKQDLLIIINGDQSIEAVTDEILTSLEMESAS